MDTEHTDKIHIARSLLLPLVYLKVILQCFFGGGYATWEC